MPENIEELAEIQSFNLTDLDISGLDTRLEPTKLTPEVITPDCGPSFLCPHFV